MTQNGEEATIHVRLALPNGGALSEADIALIETLQTCRSILGASKLMGLSYRKTWLMSDALKSHLRDEGDRNLPRPEGRRRGSHGVRLAFGCAVPLGGAAFGEGRCGDA